METPGRKLVLLFVSGIVLGVMGNRILWGTTPDSSISTSKSERQPVCTWSSDFNLPDFDGEIKASVVWDDGNGSALYVGGEFRYFGTRSISYIARWDGTTWLPLTDPDNFGIDGPVRQLVVYDDGRGEALFAGGEFSTAGGQTVNRIARWDGQDWSPLSTDEGVGLDGEFGAMVVHDIGYGDVLCVGGIFENAGGTRVNNIAAWNGTQWRSLRSFGQIGIDGEINAMTIFDGELIVGGRLVDHDGYRYPLARWDGAWIPIEGISHSFYNEVALTTFDVGSGEALYAAWREGWGGWQTVYRWDGTTWSPVVDTSGRDLNQFLGDNAIGPYVLTLGSFDLGEGQALYLGGRRCLHFNGISCPESPFVATWDGDWQLINNGSEGITGGGTVSTMTELDDGSSVTLIAGGRHLTDGATILGGIARWDSNSWTGLESVNGKGVAGTRYSSNVGSMVNFDDGSGEALFVTGAFTIAGKTPAVRIARWENNGSWSPLADDAGNGTCAVLGCSTPSGLAVLNYGAGPMLYAAATVQCSERYTSINVASWSGTKWTARGGTSCFYNYLYDLAVFDDGTGPALYGCGLFASLNETVMKFSGSSWRKIPDSGGYPDGDATAIEGWNGGSGAGLYIAGDFTEIAGLIANHIVRWDGQVWSTLEGPPGIHIATGGSIADMIVFDDGTGESLYVGGSFSLTGDIEASGIAGWDGVRWRALDDSQGNLSGDVATLGTFDDGTGLRLYATTVRRLGQNNYRNTISRWDGDRWTVVVEAFRQWSTPVFQSLFSHDDGNGAHLWVGGWFTEIEGIRSHGIARLDCTRFDYGDAPQPPYPTLIDGDGPRHAITPGVHLGENVSHEADGKPSEHADADDFDDGVAFISPLIPGLNTRIEVSASVDAVLDGWIDFNADGDWADPGERIFDHRDVSAGADTLVFDVPLTAIIGTVAVARFRLSSSGVDAPTGEAADGEVEDYEIEISANPTRPGGGRVTP